MKLRLIAPLAAILILTLTAFGVLAQEPVNPNANIAWPPPVYVLRGQVEVRGTANLPNMVDYFLSFRALDATTLQPVDGQAAPATLPQRAPVVDDVLGVWDTTIVEDGLYELFLTINVRGANAVTTRVSPLRVENIPPPFLATPTAPGVVTTQEPAPPAVSGPTATVVVSSANVRTGDSTLYPPIAALFRGDSVPIIALSTTGSRWYQIQLPDGRLGWIAGSTIDITGDLRGVPFVSPPPVPVTPTPLPTATPIASANLVAGIVVLDPAAPTCNQTFNVGFDVANLGSQQTFVSGTVSLVDARAADGSIQATTVGGFPPLAPGQTFRVNMPLTVSTWYNETHRITLVIDPTNAIPETSEGENTRVVEYVLAKGACP